MIVYINTNTKLKINQHYNDTNVGICFFFLDNIILSIARYILLVKMGLI